MANNSMDKPPIDAPMLTLGRFRLASSGGRIKVGSEVGGCGSIGLMASSVPQ
jgi:hypothetical protein